MKNKQGLVIPVYIRSISKIDFIEMNRIADRSPFVLLCARGNKFLFGKDKETKCPLGYEIEELAREIRNSMPWLNESDISFELKGVNV